ncbi:MAG: hypothetical protein JW861_03020 [Bacteroidales bacterium]|nr:hypothetical protein [Bacteroidales bacterium]
MKKILAVTVLTLASAGAIRADIIEKTFTFNEPEVITLGEYSLFSFVNTLNTGLSGHPALPWLAVKLLLPPGQSAYEMEVIREDPVFLNGSYKIYPYQPSRPLSEETSGDFFINQEVYSGSEPYPISSHGVLTTQYMNGYSIAMTTITPLQYIPSTGQVCWYGSIIVRMTTQSDLEAAGALENLSHVRRISDFAANPEMAGFYPSPDYSANDYQLLIITPSQFGSAFQDLTDLYFARGIKSEVQTRENIVSSMTGLDDQEKIRNYIIQEYQYHNIEFVLLGGDVEHIPYRGFYCYVQSGSGYEDDDIPADLYYCALDGTWNDDNDNRWGEPGEDDLLPEVCLARMSFSNTIELNNMIHKSLSYQNNPVTGELRDPLLAGEYLYGDPITWGSDYLELLIGYQNENGYITNGIPVDHNLDKLYEKNGSWGGTDLMNRINSGRSFVHHSGHANATYVAHLYNSDITNSNFSQANGINHNYTLMFSHGCICGSFDYNDCILEKMVAIENFAVSVIGNSRYGWFNEGQTEGPSAHLHREFVDALYNKKMSRLGAAFKEMKIQTAPWVTAPGQWEEGALRWNFYDINILGDPALGVWTDEPISLQATYQSAIPIATPSLQVTVTGGSSPLENFSCTVIKDGVMHGTAKTNSSGIATIFFDPVFTQLGQADLIINGYNSLATTFPITIIPNSGSYVIYSSHTVDDSQGGNGNGLPDFGEEIALGMEIMNVGTLQANNATGAISTGDTYIMITDGTENFGDIPGGGSVVIPGAFVFDIADDIPDGHVVDFELVIVSGTESWTSYFSINVNAPALETGNMIINDVAGGNGNGMLDPGESVEIIIPVLNTGNAASPACTATLSSSNPYITILQGSSNPGVITAGGSVSAVFQIAVDAATPIGTSVDLAFNASAGSYTTGHTFYQTIGLVLEDWESGDFSKFEWETGGNGLWTIVTESPYEGIYCARSGAIGDNQSTSLVVMMNVTASGNISFYRKVSSEAGYDFLRFYIDGLQQEQWSGTVAWGQVSYAVTPGYHTFQWTYIKDTYTVSGSDCAWIDYIVFPPVGPVAPTSVPYSTNFDLAGALPEGWFNAVTDDMDWTPDAGGTPSSGTGPSGDHTTGSGYYVYTESSSPNYPSKTANLVTPLFDLTSLADAQVSFWYHMYGTAMGALHLDIFHNDAWINDVMPVISGNQGNMWNNRTIDLTSYAGNMIRLRFRGITGSSYTSDMAIDDFLIQGTTANITLDLKTFLEGPFNGADMNTGLNIAGFIPLSQPYNVDPWYYTGTGAVTAIPNADVVDWVLIELRDAPDATSATSATMFAQRVGFLLRNGAVVDLDGGSKLQINSAISHNLFVVAWHRNHIGIMSAVPLIEAGGIYTYDFTTSSGQAYGGGLAHKELAPGIWGMTGGDGLPDNQINNGDKNQVWTLQAGTAGYKAGDFDMNGEVNNGDKNDVWAPNTGLGGQVPD